MLLGAIFFLALTSNAQENYKTISKDDSVKHYFGQAEYPVKEYSENWKSDTPKNVILMIGDGMGVAQVYAALTANRGSLYLKNFKNIGFQTTYSGDNFITDSGASGTALATGIKTYNHAIGVNLDTIPVENIREKCEKMGMATGVVSTSAVTHATPASFVAHESQRSMYEAIAADYLKTDIDVFIGGGYKHFTEREDGRNLTTDLLAKGYKVVQNMNDAAKVKKGKLAALLAPDHIDEITNGRGDMLPKATKTAINILDNDKDGFFMMVEASQIDWGGHQNNTTYIVTEMLDFDKAIGEALAFAAKDKETLIIITADHETGGLSINGGSMESGNVLGAYTTGGHSALMTPVFAFGPGSEKFRGIYDNTDIPKIIMELIQK
ncbi:MAG: alkaline phosphatase [Prolixibacteraceae bacterium]|nr:alkaline phosphatase [Prolixibacteraceae bacterium]